MRILIVEDDQKLARQLQKGLTEQGHTATLAFDGHAGLQSARSEPFDVFVLDVMLPGIDGFSLVRRLVKRAGISIQLTPREFEFLELLLRNSGRVLTRNRLIEAVWGNERDVENNTVDVFIRQLRTKLEPPGTSKLIHTIRGIGYTLREEESA